MKVRTRPPRYTVTPEALEWILHGLRPYGPHRHTRAEHARYFNVSLPTLDRWIAKGFSMGLYRAPGRDTLYRATNEALVWYQGRVAILQHTLDVLTIILSPLDNSSLLS